MENKWEDLTSEQRAWIDANFTRCGNEFLPRRRTYSTPSAWGSWHFWAVLSIVILVLWMCL
jgi:hypothetical protein